METWKEKQFVFEWSVEGFDCIWAMCFATDQEKMFILTARNWKLPQYSAEE